MISDKHGENKEVKYILFHKVKSIKKFVNYIPSMKI